MNVHLVDANSNNDLSTSNARYPKIAIRCRIPAVLNLSLRCSDSSTMAQVIGPVDRGFPIFTPVICSDLSIFTKNCRVVLHQAYQISLMGLMEEMLLVFVSLLLCHEISGGMKLKVVAFNRN